MWSIKNPKKNKRENKTKQPHTKKPPKQNKERPRGDTKHRGRKRKRESGGGERERERERKRWDWRQKQTDRQTERVKTHACSYM